MAEQGNIGDVKIGIKAEFDDKGLKQAERALGSLGQAAGASQSAMTRFGGAASVAGGILAVDFVSHVLGAVKTMAQFPRAVTEAASESVEAMDRIAQATGVTLQQFQALEPVMRRNGVGAEQMGTIFRVLARNIYEARDPSSVAAQTFDQLGVAMTGMESPSEVLTLIADRISKLPPSIEKTRIQAQLLGRQSMQLTALLNQGSQGFVNSAREALAMANVLNDDANNALLTVNDSFDDLNVAQDNLSKHLAVLFAPMVQGANEAHTWMVKLATTMTDDLTIATRTLHVRLQALFGFLKAQAQLSVSEIGKVPEIFERWDTWAADQIAAIRNVGVAEKDLGKTVSEVNAEQLKQAQAQRDAAFASEMGLIELDLGWKIVQREIDAYGAAQHDLGNFIVTRLNKDFKESIALQKFWTEEGLAGTKAVLEHEQALGAAYDASFAAVQRARQMAGAITPVEMATGQTGNELASIDAQISAVNTLKLAEGAALDQRMRAAALENATKEETSRIVQASATRQMDLDRQLQVLAVNRRTAEISGAAAVADAVRQEERVRLTAMESIAAAEVRIAEGSFASTEQIRELRMQAIHAQLDSELAAVGLTEAQKTAIYRRAEADRIAAANQFPSFWRGQLQTLVESNTFSVSQIVTGWTGGLAGAIVQWQNFGQTLENIGRQTATSLLQAGLNYTIQAAVQWALRSGVEIGFAATTAATVGAINAAKYSAIIAGETTTAGVTMTVWEVAATTIVGTFGAITGAIMGFFTSILIPAFIAIGKALMTFLTAIAASAKATIFGIPYGLAILAGVAIIGGAIAALATFAFDKGGIGDFGAGAPAMLHGNEAIIPLDERGASFMSDMLGMGAQTSGQSFQQTILLQLDRRTIAQIMVDEFIPVLRGKGLPA